MTKKGRTIVTAIAGSIGIIGIALVLAISTGMTSYVSEMQSDTLAGFPLTINRSVATDFFASRPNPMNPSEDILQDDPEFPTVQEVYAYNQSEATTIHTNVIDNPFLTYLEGLDTSLYNSISYSRSVALHIVAQTSAGGYVKVPTTTGGSMFFGSNTVFSEIPDNPEFIQTQYDVLAGAYPTEMNQLVLVVDEQNRLDTTLLEALGIDVQERYAFADFIGTTFFVIPNDTFYQSIGTVFVPGTDYEAMANSAARLEVSIVGILRVKEDASSSLLSTGVGYTTLLTDYLLEQSVDSAIVQAQIASPTINVLTGMPFNTQLTYESVIRLIGGDATPTGIQIYPVSFDAKEAIKVYLDEYNVGKAEAATIIYTDLAETISRTVSELINTITVILAAFAGISLVVSSIMIGIITYVSVVERTKEIGIMRSLGARKKTSRGYSMPKRC
ncbi:MAG: hypothetical protein MZU97_23755 [Bacillus subtilis]|nr:hypothetical protein [Bacillus subtilis]